MTGKGISILNRYFANQALQRLTMKDAVRRKVEVVVGLLGYDGRVTVRTVHEELFPELAVRSANTSLRRLVEAVNAAAEQAQVPLRMVTTADKRPGAEGRRVWFEGAVPTPHPSTPELDRIAPGTLIVDARAAPTDELPVVVLFTYNQHETTAVLRRFALESTTPQDTRNGVTYNLLGVHGGHRVVHRVSAQGQAASQAAAEDAYRAWDPVAMISVGIAFGQSKDIQRIGDVLVATAVYDYERTRQSHGGVTEPRGLTYPTSEVIASRIRHLDQTNQASLAATMSWPRVHAGVILSGNKLVDDGDFKTELARLWPNAVGGEMEGLGLAYVARQRGFDWALVKAICDWGDGTKNNPRKDEDQSSAADNAAVVVFGVLAGGPLWEPRFVSRPSSPLHESPGVLPREPHEFKEIEEIGERMVEIRGMEIAMAKDSGLGFGHEPRARKLGTDTLVGVGALSTLLDWLDADSAPPVFALLGEYGTGKTITCQRLAAQLHERRQLDQTQRPGLYFDLRSVTGLDRRVPTLGEILVECMSRDWPRTDDASEFTATQVYQWLGAGAVIIFDGLDEALVKMSGGDGQTFTRTLLSITDFAKQRPGCPPPRVLISCRTQYFRTLRDQQNHFTGHERRNTGSEQFRALTLLPLTDEQIFAYLRAALSGQDPERLLDMIRSVHNLSELAQRPFTLAMIAEYIPELEAARAEGRPVYGVTLYRAMAARWLDRDNGKHHIRPEDKMMLAEHLAAHLWRHQVTSLPAHDLEDWFHLWLRGTPALAARYGRLPVEQLEEDLRTATFLARVDDGPTAEFRFAHTSLQEFFLAEYLLRAIVNDEPNRWVLRTPTREALCFLAQSLAERDDDDVLRGRLTRWGHVRCGGVNENILATALASRHMGLRGPALRGIDLSGADISEVVIDGRGGNSWLDLTGANLSGISARRAALAEVCIDDADFSGADFAQAEFLDCCGTANWSGADTSGTTWRAQRLGPVDLASGHFNLPIWADAIRPHIAGSPMQVTGGNTGPVDVVKFSPDARLLASAGVDGAVRLWDPQTGRLFRELHGHTGPVSAISFSSDGHLLASAGRDGAVRLWDPQTGRLLRELQGHGSWVQSVGFGDDGQLLASADGSGALRLWELRTGNLVGEYSHHTSRVQTVAFSPNGRLLASAGGDGTVRLWDFRTGVLPRELSGHAGAVFAVGFSSEGGLLASAGDDGAVRIWDTRTGSLTRELFGGAHWGYAIGFSTDGCLLASAGDDGAVRIWDTRTGSLTRVLPRHTSRFDAVEFCSNGRLLASAGDEGAVRIWDTQTGSLIRELPRHTSSLHSLGFSPNGQLLASGGRDGIVRLWDPRIGRLMRELPGHTGWVYALEFGPNGQLLASGGRDGIVRLWDLRIGRLMRELPSHTDSVHTLGFSPDGRFLASAGSSGSDDCTVRLWDPRTGDLLSQLPGQAGGVLAMAFSADGHQLAVGGHGRTVRLLDPQSGSTLRVLPGHADSVDAVRFNADGSMLASVGDDGAIRLWDPYSGNLLRELLGHTGRVHGVAFSPDGGLLASAGHDGTVRLWNPYSGEQRIAISVVNRDLLGISGAISWDPTSSTVLYADGAYWRILYTYAAGSGEHRQLMPLGIPRGSLTPGDREFAFQRASTTF